MKAYRWEESERKTPGQKHDELIAISKKAEELSHLMIENRYALEASEKALNVMGDKLTSGMPVALMMLYAYLEAGAKVPPESSQPNRRHAHEIVFVRRLTAAMRERFNQPLAATVARAASVIFEKKITKKFVENNT